MGRQRHWSHTESERGQWREIRELRAQLQLPPAKPRPPAARSPRALNENGSVTITPVGIVALGLLYHVVERR